MSIFSDDPEARKNIPLYFFLTRYFPKALVQVTKVCVAGNVQHNPELAPTDINWARGKSTDQLNTAMRHLMDHATQGPFDQEPPEVLAAIDQPEGTYHLAKAAWRILAALELEIEAQADKRNIPEWAPALVLKPFKTYAPGARCALPAGWAPDAPTIQPGDAITVAPPRGWEFLCVDVTPGTRHRPPEREHRFIESFSHGSLCVRCGLAATERHSEVKRQESFDRYIKAHGALPT